MKIIWLNNVERLGQKRWNRYPLKAIEARRIVKLWTEPGRLTIPAWIIFKETIAIR